MAPALEKSALKNRSCGGSAVTGVRMPRSSLFVAGCGRRNTFEAPTEKTRNRIVILVKCVVDVSRVIF